MFLPLIKKLIVKNKKLKSILNIKIEKIVIDVFNQSYDLEVRFVNKNDIVE